jgi:hypothetical protein
MQQVTFFALSSLNIETENFAFRCWYFTDLEWLRCEAVNIGWGSFVREKTARDDGLCCCHIYAIGVYSCICKFGFLVGFYIKMQQGVCLCAWR